MTTNNPQAKKNANTGYGKHGWWIMIFCGLCYYMMTGTTADGLNVTVPGLSADRGWDYATLLSYSTIAGLVGLAISYLMVPVIRKIGAKKVIVLSTFIAGIGFVALGFSQTPAMYLICISIANSFACVYSFQATSSLVANWFPRKKGMAMGIITAFMPLSSATYLLLLNWLIKTAGLNMGIAITGILTMVVGVIGIFTIKDKPEELGLAPDNMPASIGEVKKLIAARESYKSPWTVKKLFTNKTAWLIALGYGLMMLSQAGTITQLIPRLTIDKGLPIETGLLMFSVLAIAGVPFSVFWGWLDTKLGTKKASILMLAWFILSIGFNLIPNSPVFLWISILMIGGDIGGTANFLVSMTTRIFGRRDFDAAYGMIYPIFNVLRTSSFAFIALFITILPNVFGQQFAGAYIGVIVLCVVSMILIGLIKDVKLGHDEDLEELENELGIEITE